MKPADVIDDVKRLLQDAVFLRGPDTYIDETLLKFVNQTIRRMVTIRPDLFSTIDDDVATTQDVVQQSLPATAVRLVEIFQVKNGNALEEVDRDMFNRAYPSWTADTSAAPRRYMRHPRNPRAYFLHPRPVAGTKLVAEYITTPSVYTINQDITVLPDAYFGSIVDGVLYLAASIHDENPSNGRAKMFYDSFTIGLGVDMRNRTLVDSEDVTVGQPGVQS